MALNLTRAVQLCVDIAAHYLSSSTEPPPQTMGETFLQLNEKGIISQELADRMCKAVGFRNIAVHNYETINWNIVHHVCRFHISDFHDFAKVFMVML